MKSAEFQRLELPEKKLPTSGTFLKKTSNAWNFLEKKFQRLELFLPVCFFVLALVFCAGRGLLRGTALSGHDATACYVNQMQFQRNLAEGNIPPRWAPDMLHGYGHAQLSFRPPLPHWLAAPVHALTGNPFLAIHASALLALLAAATGMYALGTTLAGRLAGAVAAACYVCSHYLVANMFLRGAFYEVAAAGALPWILWAMCPECVFTRRAWAAGAVAWAALIMAHPAITFFFVPMAAAFALCQRRDAAALKRHALLLACGLLLAAPYWLVVMAEKQWVRMDIFWTDLDSWRRHFIQLGTWLREQWPLEYAVYEGVDELGRPRHREMRGLNLWAMALLALIPLTILRCRRDPRARITLLFFAAALGLLLFALPVSIGVWNALPVMDSFNYPWRVLLVVNFCLAAAAGLAVQLWRTHSPGTAWTALLALPLILWPMSDAFRRSRGWDGPDWLTLQEISPRALRHHSGLPQPFYTPRWVSRYPREQPRVPAWATDESSAVRVLEQRAIRWDMEVDAAASTSVVLAHHYYPGWRVHGLDGPPLDAEPWGARGLLSFPVPPGQHKLRVQYDATESRHLAAALWLAGMLLCAGGLLLPPGRAGIRPATRPPRASLPATGLLLAALLLLAHALAHYALHRRRARAEHAGLLALAAGNNPDAIRAYSILLRECETDILARFRLAVAYHHEGWEEEALLQYGNVIRLAQNQGARAAHSAARLHLLRGDVHAARARYEEALRMAPESPDIRAEYHALLDLSGVPANE